MKYISPKMTVVSADQLKEIIKVHADSAFDQAGCEYFGALSNSYLCYVGSIMGFN